MNLQAKIETVLFLSVKPLSLKMLAKIFGAEKPDIEKAAGIMKEKFGPDSGIMLMENNGELQLVSNPACSKYAKDFVKEEVSGPLTRPQLETLAIIAYLGPVHKFVVEEIRGVNCSLILRNLLMRGLIEEKIAERIEYIVSTDFLRHLGLTSVKNLPDYDKIRNIESLKIIFNSNEQ